MPARTTPEPFLGLLAAIDVNGSPLFLRLDQSLFDSNGERVFSGNVPPGLGGLQVGFLAIGYYQPGHLGLSSVTTVTFN